ncbi:MAG: signal peptidase II [Deltaproteobacteria bacterium]|nr:signal peptidase II [Deltaproteobacteria bacterium]
MGRYKIFFIITLIIVILDQITKFIIMDSFAIHQSIEIIPGIFNLTYIRNPGAAFGMFRDGSELFRQIFLIGTSIAALIIIVYFYYKTQDGLLTKFSLSLIAGGAVGNLIDRIIFGEVIDFLDVHWKSFHWPAFNIADSAITIGVGITIYTLYIKR